MHAAVANQAWEEEAIRRRTIDAEHRELHMVRAMEYQVKERALQKKEYHAWRKMFDTQPKERCCKRFDREEMVHYPTFEQEMQEIHKYERRRIPERGSSTCSFSATWCSFTPARALRLPIPLALPFGFLSS